jgi:alginate O-acetyltransferase complex protein AlgI
VLFNTLTFAKFFAVVFLVAWLLVHRRAVLLLPWFAVGGYAAFAPQGFIGYGIAALALAFSLALCHLDREPKRPSMRLAMAAVAINFVALSWMTYANAGSDPVSLAFKGLDGPIESSQFWARVSLFLVAWLTVARRWTLLAPWLLVGAAVAFTPASLASVAASAAACLVSLGLCVMERQTPLHPRRRPLAASLLVNALALAFVSFSGAGSDAWLLSILELDQAQALGRFWTGVAILAGPIALYLLVRAQRLRMVFIILASYVFYAHWDWRFLPLIWGSSTIDWWLGRRIGEAPSRAKQRKWLLGTVAVNLTVLGVFKYFNFGIDSARAALEALGFHPPEIALRIALPVGISFFTFESMSYVIDVYRGVLKPKWSYFEYLSFVAFFPHLVAGPIVRPRDLLPQLAGEPRWNAREASEGLFLMMVGMLKKIAIGDYLAVNLVDRVFDAPTQYSALECYSAVVGYAVQIYTDFSGYTDIAIGAALLLGVRMPLNFNAPYKAPEIIDFWRRWHISLSTWLRDYLYISLGGNRKGRVRTYLNLMITMLLGGLWHGANWTFMVWGGLHGWALAVTRAVGEASGARARLLALLLPAVGAGPLLGVVMCLLLGTWDTGVALRFTALGTLLGAGLAVGALHHAWHERDEADTAARPLAVRLRAWAFTGLSVLCTFHVVGAGWIYFRSETFQKAAIFYSQLSTFTSHHANLSWTLVAALAVGMLTHWAPERWYAAAREGFIRAPFLLQGLVLLVAALVLREMSTAEAVPFVYFQF